MAGGKLSARQKMINLMYLVFIAMLALNMSKEVLSAFGSINEKLERSNTNFDSKNVGALASLEKNASQNDKARVTADKAGQAHAISNKYYDYLATQKELLLSEVDDPTDYEAMDKTSFLDELYYAGGKLTEAGKKYLSEMDAYRNGMLALTKENNPVLTEQINSDFSTDPITIDDGGTKTTQDYVSYHFVGFPSVSSLTKMTQTQNDIRSVENEYLSKLLEGDLKALSQVSEQNYETVMTTTKGAYYSSDSFDGIISLGRVDETTKPERVELKIDGRPLSENQYEFKGGRVALKIGAGSVGEHKITGNLIFMQDGEEVPVQVEKSYTTIAKPNSATIAADKMNVVYRGVVNPMTIDFAGIDPNKVNASASSGSLNKSSGTSYNMSPGTGKEVVINVNATLPNGGGPVSDKATFRIKDIPRPVGTMRNDDSGSLKMTREAVGSAPVGATLPDFDFELNLKVNSFKFKAPGAATVLVQGNKLNTAAKNALKKVRRGDVVQIFDIKAKIQGNTSYNLRKISPVLIELTN